MAERAFGLDAVPLKARQAGPAPAQSESKPMLSPPSRPPMAEPPREKSSTSAQAKPADLFGDPDSPAAPTDAPAFPRRGPIELPPLASDQKRFALAQLDEHHVRGCTRCSLCETRTNTVFGEGDVDAQIMFIGEGPGENEDEQGRPFVGRAGEKLNEMIRAMGLKREQVYICNIVKCRPPGNRAPTPGEVAACTGFLEQQLQTIRPRVIVTLGAPAAKYILQNDKLAITRIRGQWHEYRGIRVMPTFHPAYILRQYTEQTRRQVWSDLQAVMAELELPLPASGRKK